uniref:Trafficking protein particle complex subunit 11 n=1 Tax=Phlebotomus kandelakii TaxID=1109342 RepID=A0A6B2EBJ4_9DIPT
MDLSVLPPELTTTPQPLVGFYGLDVAKNTVHKAIWDAFNNNRKNDRLQLQFKLIPANYEFPVSKPKRQSYEWYHPKGILKRNWILKHLHILPALVVSFHSIELSDPTWSEKQLQCTSAIQSLRNSLQGRLSRLAIVLIQSGTGTRAAGDEMLTSERISNLSSACDVSAKMIFVLNHSDHLMGHILRLESAFLDVAQSYYTQIIKQIKMHRDQLSANHQVLKVRHQFKLGFMSEMLHDFTTALKYYTQAYVTLEDIRVVDTNCTEIKTVAGFINYKRSRLMFKINLPRDAITQFNDHLQLYKDKTGSRELLFEHYGWLSAQFSFFADLFVDAIKSGLPALQTKHPGIYYYRAAEYKAKQKEAYLDCCKWTTVQPMENIVGNIIYSDFFGVRGNKTGEMVNEQNILNLLYANEKDFNHSGAIISYLGQAMAQFKVYKCLRFRKKLAVSMAEEYLTSGDHARALTLFSLMLSDYRADKWYKIFTEVLMKTFKSAYLSPSVPDYVSCSIEAMSPRILISKTDRIFILENLWRVFQGVVPISNYSSPVNMDQNWEYALQGFTNPVIIDLDKICDLFSCDVSFMENQAVFDEEITIELRLKSLTEVPLKIRGISVVLNSPKLSVKLKAKKVYQSEEELKESELMVLPGNSYRAIFTADSRQFTENDKLSIGRVELQIGSDKRFAVLLKSTTLNQQQIFKGKTSNAEPSKDVNSSCYIVPTYQMCAQVNLSDEPMLMNEFYRVVINLFNNLDSCIENVGVSVTVPAHLKNKVFLATDISESKKILYSTIQINVGDKALQSSTSITYYVISLTRGNIELNQKTWYQITPPVSPSKEPGDFIGEKFVPFDTESPTHQAVDKGTENAANHNIKIEYGENCIKKTKEDTIMIPCQDEIQLTATFYTLNRKVLFKAYQDEDFILRIQMEVKATCDIDILETTLITADNIKIRDSVKYPKISGKSLKCGARLEDSKIISVQNKKDDLAILMRYMNINHPSVTKPTNASEKFKSAIPVAKETPSQITTTAIKSIYGKSVETKVQDKDVANEAGSEPMGVYVVRWRRTNSTMVNESKFSISGLEVIEPKLNIYCFILEKVYVRVPFQLRIQLKNPGSKILSLQATLDNSDTFMFSGHRQLNVSIFSYATHDLIFILYPLKSGWQSIPQLFLKYLTGGDGAKEEITQSELNLYVQRWMPKRVFVHPPHRVLG